MGKTWDIAENWMRPTGDVAVEIPSCVVALQPYGSPDFVAAPYSSVAAVSFFGGCAPSTITHDYYWSFEDGCVKLFTADSGHLSYVLKSDKSECTVGWSREVAPTLAYEVV